jgi:hypothetical protein|tara:strand:- start:276 stop:1256 length:981 start_codon:yes stop_codon:yes gene_type:complete
MKRTISILVGMLLSGNALGMEHGCAASAQSLFLACGFDVKEGYLEGLAVCGDTNDQDEAGDCTAEIEEARDEDSEECDDVLEARLEVCEKLDDAAHEVQFGEDYAENFVDPLEIGVTIDPNPWFPLVQGNVWVYEASGIDEDGEEVEETITVTVTDAVKLIEGIRCLVVNDTGSEEGVVLEDTDDWFAQDVEGNVWYCGEISRNQEVFEGDEPEEPELVELEGSWKSGRDGAEAGMLLPLTPVVGELIRQEILYGDAEDVMEIESLEGTESTPVASCSETCLVTLDYTALEPGEFENKYYAAGIGLIVETKVGSSERVELVEFTNN